MTFSAATGIRFRESMTGHLTDGEVVPAEPGASPARFAFTLFTEIPSLRAFLDSSVHQARVAGGAVDWEGHLPRGTPVAAGGAVIMYRDVTPDGRHKKFDFVFSAQAPDGTWITFTGEKRLSDDRGFDAAADLSTLYVVASASGQRRAAGITRVHVAELLDQLVSIEVTAPPGSTGAADARGAFFTFMNEQIHRVYPAVPRLLQADEDRYLSPSEWRALSLLTTLMLPDPLPPDGPTVDDSVLYLQEFIRNASAPALAEIRNALNWAGLAAPLAAGFIPEIRRVLRGLLASPDTPPPAFLDLLQRVAVLPYYAHPKADRVVGYRRPTFTPTARTRLAVTATPSTVNFDTVIVGAGVAGSLLADRLTAAGQRVLVLEAGPYVAEADMSTDEVTMTARLYTASGLQTADAGGDASFSVLQGACVGGGGTVNNAVCFQLPAHTLAGWQRLGFPVSAATMGAAYAAVADELGIRPISRATRFANPAGMFLGGLGECKIPSVDAPPTEGLHECLVNLVDCDGLGLCNSGCGNERKRNALQVHLPRALATGRCELVPSARVSDLHVVRTAAGPTVAALTVRVADRPVAVVGKQVVLCAGAVASSALLLGAPDVAREIRALPVGKRFSANVGCPSFVFSRRRLHERPSLQISHYYLPPAGGGFVIESWFAPPGALAVAMPGYLDEHAARMRRFDRTVVIAPLVGTQPKGEITLARDGAARIRLPIEEHELTRLRDGIALIARTALSAAGGEVDEVLAGTRRGTPLRDAADVDRFARTPLAAADLRMGTGHPQGGNAMSDDPAIGVVDAQFRVRGLSNLRVCDASVFPSVAGVNPQWTVMALAHHCGALMTAT